MKPLGLQPPEVRGSMESTNLFFRIKTYMLFFPHFIVESFQFHHTKICHPKNFCSELFI